MDSDLSHYGFDIALRDTWRTRLGGLSAGLAISYFAFDQEFQVEYNSVRLFNEDLNSDFFGGKGFVGWDGFVMGHASTLDLSFGYFNLDVEYDYKARALPGDLSLDLADHAATVEAKWTTWKNIGDWQTGLSFGGMYITDMPQINHLMGSTATLSTTDAATLSAAIEILL